MSLINWFDKPSPKTTKPQNSHSCRTKSETFILEPILTPSGIVDGFDETPDALPLEDIEVPEVDAPEVADAPETEDTQPDIATTDEVEAVETPEADNLIPDADIEEIEFITDSPTADAEEVNGVEAVETESEIDGSPESVVAQALSDAPNADSANEDVVEPELTVDNADPEIEPDDTTGEEDLTVADRADEAVPPESEADEGAEADEDNADLGTDAAIADNPDESAPTDSEPEETTDEPVEDSEDNEEAQLTPVEPEEQSPAPTGIFTVGETGEIEIEYLFDGGKYQGEVALFSLDGMDDLEPGSEAFIQEAAARALGIEPQPDVGVDLSTDLSDPDLGEPAPTDTDLPAENAPKLGEIVISDKTEGAKFEGILGEKNWNKGEFSGVKTVQMRPGDTFGIMLVPNKTVQQVFDNPSIGGSGRPLFSLSTANPDGGFHVGQIADVTGDGNTFVMEDIRVDGSSDYDYNDIIFRIKGATGDAVDLDDVIDADNDWRETELGQEILDYVFDTLEPEDVAATITDDLDTELVPELEDVLSELKEQLEEITENPDIVNEDPPPDAPTEQEQDALIAELNAELEAAFAELTEDEFADVNALAGKFEFDPEDQPLVGVIDTGFAETNPDIDDSRITLGKDYIDGDDNPLLAEGEGDDHGTKVLEVIAATQNNNVGIDGVNDDAPLWLGRAVGSGKWADSLVEFVDAAKESEQPNAVVNLSFDLTQENPDGSITTRTEFTEPEIAALKYARDNNVLIVAAAGNQGEAVMSALGQASEDFDNVITVGAADEAAERAENSSYGNGLDLLAYGSRLDDPTTLAQDPQVDAFAGLSAEEIELVELLMEQSEDSGTENAATNSPGGVAPTAPIPDNNTGENASTPTPAAPIPANEPGSSITSTETSIPPLLNDNFNTENLGTGDIATLDPILDNADTSENRLLSSEEEAKALAATQKMLANVLASLEDSDDSEWGQPALTGTSIAAAKVTGAASQVWAANPDLNFAQVKAILKDTAVDLHTPGWDMETGAGLLNLGLAVQAASLTQGEAYTLEKDPVLSGLGLLNGAATPAERPAFFKKLWRGVKRVFSKVVRVVKKVVTVVKKVVNVVKKVVSFVKKAVPILKSIGSFVSGLAKKFVCLPILGKVGVVLGGIALVGAAIGGAVLWFKNKKKQQQQQQQQQVVVQQIPQQILDLENAWKLLTPAEQNNIGPALKNGIDPKFHPLFNGSDPDGILPLLQTISGLTPTQRTELGGHVLNGVPASWTTFFNGSNPANPNVPASTKNAWNSLTAAQRSVLQPFMLNGVSSPYGRPLFDGSAEGQQITNVLNTLGSQNLNNSQRSLMISFMLNPGGIPTEYESRFP
ncbi:S8 family serine peptidase [Roseofilum capinflatum]|uniref:S8 family serine peptidase n=1 Tax=Roseofilum capinflatum BLCC-M114 TaxID=3022440 RepID=A0ABT7B4H0_9CYAN|nr:S8 family serine peptidase [Roseofilum capinflatum]MDJ1174072.1 S8 family serine peptidase [Roseofilum capinflatum BLCC-M114]